jgi:hypothetical protein
MKTHSTSFLASTRRRKLCRSSSACRSSRSACFACRTKEALLHVWNLYAAQSHLESEYYLSASPQLTLRLLGLLQGAFAAC